AVEKANAPAATGISTIPLWLTDNARNMAFAHSENRDGVRQDLVTHLTGVARRAEALSAKFEASTLGYWTGFWHDVGKFHPDFQAYLANPGAARGPDHKGAGALLARKYLEPLVFLDR